MTSAEGTVLFADVEHYFGLGIHRTGTAVDDATVAWMSDRLAQSGLAVEQQPVAFDRWVADTSVVTVDGQPVDHLPVFHEWTGAVTDSQPFVARFDPQHGGRPKILDEPIAAARAAGAGVAVLATDHPEGALVAVNRVPGAGSGFPTILIAGHDFERADAGGVHVELAAHLEPGRTTNVVAANEAARADPDRALVLTTPLNGWFGCAGERGTGIAVLLHLVGRLAHRPMLVVASGGHELTNLGITQWVDRLDHSPAAIIHVGASVAVTEPDPAGGRRLASTRVAMTSLPADRVIVAAAALKQARLNLAADTDRWLGEAQVLRHVGVPLLSFTGAGLDFHTPNDTPDRATSPHALATTADAFAAAAEAVHDAALAR